MVGPRLMGTLVTVLALLSSSAVVHAQNMPPAPAPPASAATIRDLQFVATTPTRIAPGGSVTFRVSFQLDGQGPRQVETGLAWTVAGGALQYGQSVAMNAVSGANSQNHVLTIPNTITQAFDANMYGIVRFEGKVYGSQQPIVLSVVPGGAGPAPNPPAPAPQPTPAVAPPTVPENPNLARVRAALQQRGHQVRGVYYYPPKGNSGPIVGAVVDADYSQVSAAAVINLGSKVHATLYGTYPMEAQMLLSAGQSWTRYLIILWVKAADVTTFIRAHQAATTDAQRNQAWEIYVRTLWLTVWDYETGQQVNEKDFMDKNFTR